MKNIKYAITLIAIFLAYVLGVKAINTWESTTAQRTMFQYGKGECSMGRDLIITCKPI